MLTTKQQTMDIKQLRREASNSRTWRRLCWTAISLLVTPTVEGQQAPAFATKKFDVFPAGAGHRRNMCDRQSAIYRDEISLDQALAGLELSVVLTNYSSWPNRAFFGLNEDGVIDPDEPGLFAVLLDELARRAGFSWRNSYGIINPLDTDGEDRNRTWSDLLSWETQSYDLAAGKWDRTVSRMKNEISFPYGWFDASVILVERLPDAKSLPLNIWSFLTPFDAMIWLMIAISVITTGLLYWLLEKMNDQADERSLQNEPGAAVFYSALSFTGHMDLRPASMSARILTFSMSFWALIVIAAYTANMASFLVSRGTPHSVVKSIDEAAILRLPLCIQGGVAMDDYITEHHPDAILVRMNNEKQVLEGLNNGVCVAALVPLASYDTYKRDVSVNSECRLTWEGRVELNIPSGFATAIDTGTFCSSLISYVVDLHMTQMQADGFLDRAWKRHLARVGDHTCSESIVEVENPLEEITNRLSLREMAGIFIVHGFLTLVAALLAFVQWSCSPKGQSRLVKTGLLRPRIRRTEMVEESEESRSQEETLMHQVPDDEGEPTTGTHVHHLPENEGEQTRTNIKLIGTGLLQAKNRHMTEVRDVSEASPSHEVALIENIFEDNSWNKSNLRDEASV